MKKIFMILIITATILNSVIANTTPESSTVTQLHKVGIVTAKVLQGLCIHYGLQLVHELGHTCTATFLINNRYGTVTPQSTNEINIKLRNNLLLPFIPFFARFPQFVNPSHNITTDLTACGLGLLASYGLLKGSNIWAEIKKGKSLKESLKDGFQKPLISNEQSYSIIIPASTNLAINCIQLLPIKYKGLSQDPLKFDGFSTWKTIKGLLRAKSNFQSK